MTLSTAAVILYSSITIIPKEKIVQNPRPSLCIATNGARGPHLSRLAV
jgi:hypothetical protein